MSLRIYYSLCLLALVFLVGCGGNLKLTGKVVFSDDKSPLTSGIVNFISDKGVSRGQIQKDGTYTVGSLKEKDGLPPGDYKVYITSSAINIVDKKIGMVRQEYQIDNKYEKADTSGLTVKVDKSMTYDIEVDRYQGK